MGKWKATEMPISACLLPARPHRKNTPPDLREYPEVQVLLAYTLIHSEQADFHELFLRRTTAVLKLYEAVRLLSAYPAKAAHTLLVGVYQRYSSPPNHHYVVRNANGNMPLKCNGLFCRRAKIQYTHARALTRTHAHTRTHISISIN